MTDENHDKIEGVLGRMPGLSDTIVEALPEGTGYTLLVFAPAVDEGGPIYLGMSGTGETAMQIDALHSAAATLEDGQDIPPGDPIAIARDLSPDMPLQKLTTSAARSTASAAEMVVDHLGLHRHTLLGPNDSRAKGLAILTTLIDAAAYHAAGIIGDDPVKRTEIMRELDKAMIVFSGGTPAPDHSH